MNFSVALEAMKQGNKVARASWNGKQWVMHRYPDGTSIEGYPPMAIGNFCLKNAQDCMQPGWVPSTADMMANDWDIAKKISD